VLLEKCIFSIHMCAVKKAVPVDNLIPKPFADVCSVVILLCL